MTSQVITEHAQQASAYTNLVLVEASDILYSDEKVILEKSAEILGRLARR